MITEKAVVSWSATLTSSDKRTNKEYRIITRFGRRYTNSLA